MSPRGVGSLCLGETRVFVCLLPVLMSCVRSSSGWVRPALILPVVFARCASPSQ